MIAAMTTQKATAGNKQALIVLAFSILYLVWGSTYLVILFALKSFPPFFLGGIRFLIAGIILICWCLIKKQSIPKLLDIAKLSLIGILLLSFATGAVIWAEQYLPSSIAAITPATVPVWLVILDKRNWKSHFTNRYLIAGLLIGFLGVIFLVGGNVSGSSLSGNMSLISFIVLLGGAISWSIGTLYSKYKTIAGATSMKTSIQMIAAGIFSLLLSATQGEYALVSVDAISNEAIWSLAYLVIMGSIAGYMAYVWLISVKSAPVVGTFVYVNPAVALLLGWLFAGEKIAFYQIAALVIILIGVLLVNLSKEKLLK